MDVKDCMTKNVCCCTPNTNVAEVAKLMCDNHIGCVPVCDEDNKVVGVLTDRDVILRSISCNKDVNTTPVSEVMTCGVCCCKPDTTIDEATKLMSDFKIRRIPVCDQNNKIIGILSLGDLANHDKTVGQKQICNTLQNICECGDNSKNAE